MLLDLLHAWRDFFVVTATAGASLIGAMFVVVSVGIGFLTRERLSGTHAYITSTVVHMGAVVLASLWTMVPPLEWASFGGVLIVGGIVGLAYEVATASAVRHFRADWTDYVWYGAVPLISYAAVIAAGAMSIVGNVATVDVLAVAVVALLICGVRNAWDMILVIVIRPEQARK